MESAVILAAYWRMKNVRAADDKALCISILFLMPRLRHCFILRGSPRKAEGSPPGRMKQ